MDTDYIKYWLGSIHTYSSREAPVIVALSHAEDNGADPEKVCVNDTKAAGIFLFGSKEYTM